MVKTYFLYLALLTLIISCGQPEGNGQQEGIDRDALSLENEEVDFPDFNSDSAYHFIQRQVDFGPRVPSTETHKECANYLKNTLKRFAGNAQKQDARVRAYDGTPLDIYNIQSSFYPEYDKRVLLGAHWDSRPYADMAQDPEKQEEPIPGANDGGSGVGVILEIARILKEHDPGIGVDIVLFDAEDYGKPHFRQNHHSQNHEETWALGSQYWSRNLDDDHNIDKGILLDMVGAYDARFLFEGYSMKHAPSLTREVWDNAHQLTYSNFFIKERTIPITDDHKFVNEIAEIPMINIIDHDPDRHPHGFNEYWHTHGDDMDIISKRTLNAVGETVLKTLFDQKAQ